MAIGSPGSAGAPGKKTDNRPVIIVASLIGLCLMIVSSIAIQAFLRARKGSNEATTNATEGLLEARKERNESVAIGALNTIVTAEALFREGDKDGDRVLDYGSLDELGRYRLVDPALASGMKQGYRFIVVPDAVRYSAWAGPVAPGKSGDRYFFMDESGIIRYSMTRDAAAHDPPIDRR